MFISRKRLATNARCRFAMQVHGSALPEPCLSINAARSDCAFEVRICRWMAVGVTQMQGGAAAESTWGRNIGPRTWGGVDSGCAAVGVAA